MLRNRNATLPGGHRVFGTPFVGLLGSQINAETATGTHGAGLIQRLLAIPADNDKRYRLLVKTIPTGLTAFEVAENGSLYATGANGFHGDGLGELFENNLSLGDVPIDVTIGSATTAPTITVQPQSQSVVAGNAATFSVSATGTAPLLYQWQISTDAGSSYSNITGATSASYTTGTLTTADTGKRYRVVVSNGTAPDATSSAAVLTVTAAAVAPTITVNPASQTVSTGATATFSVTATGTPTLTYQWKKNGTNITGATSSSYTTPATSTGDSGSVFTVVVSNGVGSVTSTGATLTVTAMAVAPSITQQPTAQTAADGASASFSVTATGTAPLTYQWRRNGTAITGATSASYSFTAAYSNNGAVYSVVVSNGVSPPATSNGVALTVTPIAPGITTQPASQTAPAGSQPTFSVLATGTAPLTYQWRKNGTNITGATSSSYTAPTVTVDDDGAAFSVVVSGPGGSVTSASAILTIAGVVDPTRIAYLRFAFDWQQSGTPFGTCAFAAVENPSVNEGSTRYLTVSCFDIGGVAAVPTSFSYRIDNPDSGQNIVAPTSLAPAAIMEIKVPASANAIADDVESEPRSVTVQALYGSGDAITAEFDYTVVNLPFIPING